MCVCSRACVDVRACAFPPTQLPDPPLRWHCSTVGPPLRGEAAPIGGCDGGESRSGGGALHGPTALPAVEGTHTDARTHARARTHTCLTPAASPNEKASRNVREGLEQLQRLKGARETRELSVILQFPFCSANI